MSACVLITRPKGEAQDYAEELDAQGVDTYVAPMLEVVPVAFEMPSEFDVVIFTSAQGVRSYIEGQGVVKGATICVGKYTAQAARDFGFLDVFDVSGTGKDVVEHIVKVYADQSVCCVHIGGEHVAYPIAEMLCAAGIVCSHVPVYSARKVNGIPADVIAAMRGKRIDVVTFFSKRTAENFLDLVAANGLGGCLNAIKCLSISAAVIECVRLYKYEWNGLYVSLTPDRVGMLEQLKLIEKEICDVSR